MRKYISYILILIALIGLFSPITKASAQTASQQGICTMISNTVGTTVTTTTSTVVQTYAECFANARYQPVLLFWASCTFVGTNGEIFPTTKFTETSCKALPKGTYTMYPILDSAKIEVDKAEVKKKEAETKAEAAKKEAEKTQIYQLLAPLPCESGLGCANGELKTFDTKNGLGSYLNLMIKIFIGLCAVLSVVMIIVGGLEYMTSELAHTKEAGKERITQAILGLLIALGAYALLFTINPDLLKSDIKPPEITVKTPVAKDSKIFIPLGTCTFKRANGNGDILNAQTTEENCKLNGENFISWKKN